ncbi:MAG: hypothetical protein J6Y54_00210, partial [Lentisphaeria bacterium]|nr:hypothetical protein [Lentisphaeria bacterium]
MRWRAPGENPRKHMRACDVAPNAVNLDAILGIGCENVFREIRPFLDAADLSIVQWETPLAED